MRAATRASRHDVCSCAASASAAPAPHARPGCVRALQANGGRGSMSTTRASINGVRSSPGSPSPSAVEAPGLRLTPTSTPVQIAYHANTLGFGFSAGGLLFPYFLGVANGLRDVGALRDDTPVAGASAGSLIAACVKSGLSHDELVQACLELAAECRAKGTRHNLGPVLRKTLLRVLPDDVHERANARNVHVAVTRLEPSLQPMLINRDSMDAATRRFTSRDDLIDALLTSCHIPWYLTGAWTTRFRGARHVDGGLSNFIPTPTGTTHNVRVCCFAQRDMRRSFGELCIAPDKFDPDWPHDIRTMLGWAFHPADDEQLEQLVTKGERDAAAWAAKNGLPGPAPGGLLLQRQGSPAELQPQERGMSL